MIIPPLEQFNILSVYDFSLVNVSSSETLYAKLLLCVWYFTHQFPISTFSAIRDFAVTEFPFFQMAQSAFFEGYVSIIAIFATGIEFIASQISYILIQTNLTILYEIVDTIYGLWHSSLSSLWYTFYTHVDFLYSADHLFFTHVPMLLLGILPGDPSLTVSPAAYLFESMNFSVITGGFWYWCLNCYWAVHELICSVGAKFYGNAVELPFSIDSKQLSFLIFSLNTSTIWLFPGFAFITFLFKTIISSAKLLPKNSWQALLEALYNVILGVVSENAGPKGIKHFPLIFTTFMLILVCNIFGMIPYSFTVTSHLIVTFSTALAIFIGINISGILKNGKHFLSLFFPPGAPLALAPLLVMIELVSYVFRVLSLSIRLFANLMSGHTLLKILSSFGWAAVSFWGIFIIPLIVIFLITGLEVAIACLQAYIFSVLLCIYINDAFNLH